MAKSSKREKTEDLAASKKGGRRLFPKCSLEDALIIPQKLKELNGGNAWTPEPLAKACDTTRTSVNFFYLTAAARDYGLTTGTRDASKIELTTLGREVVYAPNPTSEVQAKTKAFLNVEVFKKVLEYYKGGVLPEMKYLGNTLENEFEIAPEFHEDFSKLFKENCTYLNIKSGQTSGGSVSPNFSGDGKISNTIVVGEPEGKPGPKLFVIMPFVEKAPDHPAGFFNEVLSSLITPAAVQAGFQVETANRQGSDVIQSTILNDLLAADLVLADLTEHNPNVLFELGVRMAHNKPIVLVKAKGTGRIFDIDNMLRVYEYDSNLWKSTVETDLLKLKEHVETAWKNRGNGQTYMNILLKGTVSMTETLAVGLPLSNAPAPTGLSGNA